MFLHDISLAKHSNYCIGGRARNFFEAKTVDELKDALSQATKEHLPVFVLGGGTNILFDDSDFDGLVLKPNLNSIQPTTFQHSAECWNVVVGSGMPVSKLLDYTIANGLSGLEWAGGLPGTLGGAIRGNAGCFGGEMKDVIESVSFLQIPNHKLQTTNPSTSSGSRAKPRDKFQTASSQPQEKSEIKTYTNQECAFNYRDSIFKRNSDYLILEATLSLKKGDKHKIYEAIHEKIDYRKMRHPMEYPNIGSIFKNIPVSSLKHLNIKTLKSVVKLDPFPIIPAAHLISETGLKGVSYGGAMISPKHPNFIVNVQSASSLDVKNLIWLTKNNVKEKFGIELEEEVIILPRTNKKSEGLS